MTNAVVKSIREAYGDVLDDSGHTHYSACWKAHWPCALARLTDEIEHLESRLRKCGAFIGPDEYCGLPRRHQGPCRLGPTVDGAL